MRVLTGADQLRTPVIVMVGAIFAIVTIAYRRPVHTALIMVPLLFGVVIQYFLMSVLGYEMTYVAVIVTSVAEFSYTAVPVSDNPSIARKQIIRNLDGEFDTFMKVSLEDVKRVAQKYFVPEGRLVMRVMPRGGIEK